MSAVEPPFGRLLTAMVTPFDANGEVDHEAAAELARHLVDDLGNDGLVINGTTGESPTTTDAEKSELIKTVVATVGDRAKIIAGVGTFDTRHTIESAAQATAAGADGLLVVTPYYSKPPQSGLLQHFTAVADSAELPILVYDIPHRTGTAIATATMIELARHPRIVGVKDAKGDLAASSQVIAATDLAYYSGEDALLLCSLAIGGVGVVGTSTHFSGLGTKQLIEAYLSGDHGTALKLHQQLLPIYTGIFASQGCILVKAGLEMQGRGVGGLRSPLLSATEDERAALAKCLEAAGI